MTTSARFFDSVSGDRQYFSQDFADVFAGLVGRDGALFGFQNALAVAPTSPASLAVDVDTGAAWVQGRYFEVFASKETVTISTADPTDPRIDRIVVRLDLSARTITLAAKAGTPAASPSPPSLQRDSTIWELSLAQVAVAAGATQILSGDITDERADATVCGYNFGWVAAQTLDNDASLGHTHDGTEGQGGLLDARSLDFRGAAVRKSSDQLINAQVETALTWETVTYDTDGWYSGSQTTRLTVPSGFTRVRVSANVTWGASSDGNVRQVRLFKNNLTVAGMFADSKVPAGSGVTQHNVSSAVLSVSPGDFFEVMAFHNASTSVPSVLTGSHTWFAIEGIG